MWPAGEVAPRGEEEPSPIGASSGGHQPEAREGSGAPEGPGVALAAPHPTTMELARNASLAPPHNVSLAPAAYSTPAVAGLSAVVGFLIAFTIVGNVLVVIAVLTSGALRAPQNLFLVSLASADILVAALVMPFSLANELMAEWSFGKAWCSIYLALDVLFCTSSIVHLCAISLDRYWSVTQAVEYNHKRTPRRIKGIIVVVWLLSALISSPPLVAKYWEPEGEPPSQCKLNDDTWYILSSCVGSFFAPCLIMVLVYVRIYRVAKLRTRTLSEKRAPPEDGASVPAQSENGMGGGGGSESWWGPRGRRGDVELEESSTSERRQRRSREESRAKARRSFASSATPSGGGSRLSRASLRSLEFFASRRRRRDGSLCQRGGGASQAREKRFTFVLAVVMGVFVVCWFPFFFSYSLYGICREACQAPEALFKFFFWIGYCNSSLNPVIYTIFNQDFRRSFKHILFGRRRRKRKGKSWSQGKGKSWRLASLH